MVQAENRHVGAFQPETLVRVGHFLPKRGHNNIVMKQTNTKRNVLVFPSNRSSGRKEIAKVRVRVTVRIRATRPN